jgi:hypothetical protein
LFDARPSLGGWDNASFLHGFQAPVNGSQGCIIFFIEKVIAGVEVGSIHVVNLARLRRGTNAVTAYR